MWDTGKQTHTKRNLLTVQSQSQAQKQEEEDRGILPKPNYWKYNEEICVLLIIFPKIIQVVTGTGQCSENSGVCSTLKY